MPAAEIRRTLRVLGRLAPLALLLAGACDPLPLKRPVTVPVPPKVAGSYVAEGRRITMSTAGLTVAAEPLGEQEVRQVFAARTGTDMNPFALPDGRRFLVLRVVVVNKTDRDLTFNPVYATLDAKEHLLYHVAPSEAAQMLQEGYPKVDLQRVFERVLYEESMIVNPHRYVSRLMLFEPLRPDVRRFTLALNQVGVGEGSVDVVFPFQVVEEGTIQVASTPALALPPGSKEQKD